MAPEEGGSYYSIVCRTWEHVPELSEGKLTDRVTILNPVAASIGEFLRDVVIVFSLLFISVFLITHSYTLNSITNRLVYTR